MTDIFLHLLLLVLLFLPFFIAMGFTFPLGDDFARANYAQGIFDVGRAFSEMVHAWKSWSGRYTHHFLVIFLGKAAESRLGYTLVCAAATLVYWISLYGIFFELMGRKRRGDSFLIASVCMLGLFCGHPSLNISYYLITDILGIGLGNGLILSFIWSLCRLWNSVSISRKLRIAIFGTGIAAIGCYEHAAIAAALTAGIAYTLAYFSSHPHKKTYLLVFKVIVLFFLISFLARGNFRRQTKREVMWDQIWLQLIASWSTWKTYAFSVFSSVWALTALFVGLTVKPATHKQPKRPFRQYIPLIGGIASFFALTTGIVLVQALSDVPISGASKLTASMSLLSCYALVFVFIHCMGIVRRISAVIPLPLLILPLVAVLVLTPNYQRTLHSLLSGETAAYASSLEKRYALLNWAGWEDTSETVKVSPLLLYPFPASLGEAIPSSPTEWPAQHVARMFKLGEVASAPPDLSYVHAKAMAHRYDWQSTSDNALGMVVFRNITAGPNDTFRFHWIVVDPSLPSSSSYVSTLILIRRQLDRPVPVFLQRIFEKKLLPQQTISLDGLLRYAGITGRHELQQWKVEGNGKTLGLAPIAAPEWGELLAVYASTDGNVYHKVPIMD